MQFLPCERESLLLLFLLTNDCSLFIHREKVVVFVLQPVAAPMADGAGDVSEQALTLAHTCAFSGKDFTGQVMLLSNSRITGLCSPSIRM